MAHELAVWFAAGKPPPGALVTRLVFAVILDDASGGVARKLALEAGRSSVDSGGPAPNVLIGRLIEAVLARGYETPRARRKARIL